MFYKKKEQKRTILIKEKKDTNKLKNSKKDNILNLYTQIRFEASEIENKISF